MKHCPNSVCPGLEQFRIVSEFNDSASDCADCGTALVNGPAPAAAPAARPEPDVELVAVASVVHEPDLIFVESLLVEAEIPYLARGAQIQDLFGFGRLVGVNPITEPVEILVRADDAEDARAVLADFLAGDEETTS